MTTTQIPSEASTRVSKPTHIARKGPSLPRAKAILDRGHQAWTRGCALAAKCKHAQAIKFFEQATGYDPEDGLYWLNLSNSERHIGDITKAITHGMRAFKLKPSCLVTCNTLGEMLRVNNRFEELLDMLEQLDPATERDATWHVLKGTGLLAMKDAANAAQSFLSGMLNASNDDKLRIKAAQQLGHCLMLLRRHDEAAVCYRMLVDANPDALGSAMYAAHSSAWACDWSGLDEDMERLSTAITLMRHRAAGTAVEAMAPFCLLTLTDDPELLKWTAQLALSNTHDHAQPAANTGPIPRHNGKIRIGLLSGDFYFHATAILITEALEHLDRSRFELFLYSTSNGDQSALRQRLEAAATCLHEAKEWTSAKIAEQIKSDGIGVMFDLKGFTLGSRVDALQTHPAPLQVAWLGYPGTSGAAYLDYIIGDPVVTPLDAQPYYTEYIAQMPGCYQPNDSTRSRPTAWTRAQCELPDSGIVFGSFNQSYKIIPEMFQAWCTILERVPGSVLWMLVPEPTTQARLAGAAAAHGIDPARILFAPFLPTEQHRARLPNADLFLDCFPCSGHTTASDALWAGVPVLTLLGQSFASRVASSLLSDIGVPELVTSDLAHYVDEAVRYALDPQALSALKQKIEHGRLTSNLFNGRQFAHDLGDLLTRMIERHDAGLAPTSLPAVRVAPPPCSHSVT